jgi:hypothetical protein
MPSPNFTQRTMSKVRFHFPVKTYEEGERFISKWHPDCGDFAYPVYAHTPTRGELATGRHISSPHG